ncbi:MAG: FAD-dependent oxidoreductase [Thermodesulfobacteriota bacterium]
MSNNLERVVIVGNGMAGQAALDEIVRGRNKAENNFDIVVFGGEANPCYNRILLSDVLSGKRSLSQLYMKKNSWYEENNIKLYTGSIVNEIDTKQRWIRTEKGFSSPFDKLVIATGSHPFIPPIKGINKKGVYAYRTINDVWSMVETARYKDKAVVIGGGLLGLEAAKALLDNGMEVTVIHLLDRLMEQQLDYDASAILKKQLEIMGLNFVMGGVTEEIAGNGYVEGVKLQNGNYIDTDLVIICTGIRPNTELAKNSGLMVNRGVVVNDYMETSADDIYAVGECVEHRGTLYGLFDPLIEQTRVAADSITGDGEKIYEGSLLSAVLKVAGINLVSIGEYLGSEDYEDLVISDPERGIYKKIVLDGNKIVGAILLGDTKDYRTIFNYIKNKTSIEGKRDELLFGSQTSEIQTENKKIKKEIETANKKISLTPANPDYQKPGLHERDTKVPWLAKIDPADIKARGMNVDFENYRKNGFSAIDPSDFLRLKSHGYCSQKQTEYFMRRIRVPGGKISAPQLRCISNLAEKYGGWVHITTRQALELHWTRINDIEIDEQLSAVGLSTRSACGHAIRNVACSESAGIDIDEVMDVMPWVKATNDYIVVNSLSINKKLPRKMNVFFANSSKQRSHAMVNDIGFVAVNARYQGEISPGFEVWIGGSLGSKPHLSHKLMDFIPPDQTIPIMKTIIDIYGRHGNLKGSKNPRLKALIEEWGFERFHEEFLSHYSNQHPPIHGLEIINEGDAGHDDINIEGVYKQKQEGYYRVVVRVPLGELTASQSRSLSELCLKYGDGKIQNTMQQNIEFHWVREENLTPLLNELGKIDLAPRGSGSIIDVMSCPGTTFCVWGVSNSQGVSDSLIKHLDKKGYTEDKEIRKLRVQISGCPNSCAQHQVADIGLSGSAGKFFLYLGGHMNGAAKVGEIVRRGITAEEVNATVEEVLKIYLKMRFEDETFIQFVSRIGTEKYSGFLSASLDSTEAIENRRLSEIKISIESDKAANQEFNIKFKLSGKTLKIRGDENILQKALDEGLSLPFSCQQGVCGTCKLRVKGKFDQPVADGISAEEIAAGDALICVAKPRGDMEIEA